VRNIINDVKTLILVQPSKALMLDVSYHVLFVLIFFRRPLCLLEEL